MDVISGASTPANYFRWLRERLTNYGLSANKLAAAAGMDPPRLSRYMNKAVDIRLSTIARLEAAFQDLLEGAGYRQEGKVRFIKNKESAECT